MKFLLLFILKILSRRIIKKHNPLVVGITGSIGKTSCRHFIYKLLKDAGADVYAPEVPYNGEFGLPLSIMRAKSGGKSLSAWLQAFITGWSQTVRKYPKIILLEYGIDRPKEMRYMTSIVEPDIVLFTTFYPNHIMNFESVEAYYDEKRKLVTNDNQFVITNGEDEHQKNIRSDLTYGHSTDADWRISHIEQNREGIHCQVHTPSGIKTIEAPLFGTHNLPLLTGALAVVHKLGYEEKRFSMQEMSLPAGRGNIFQNEGLTIIDSSYNGGRKSIEAGIRETKLISEQQRIPNLLVLGDMRELGSLEQSEHEELAETIAKTKPSMLALIGTLHEKHTLPKLESLIYKGDLIWSRNSRLVGKTLHAITKDHAKNAVVFGKGSQNTIYIESALEWLLSDQQTPALPRQSKEWKKHRDNFFSTIDPADSIIHTNSFEISSLKLIQTIQDLLTKKKDGEVLIGLPGGRSLRYFYPVFLEHMSLYLNEVERSRIGFTFVDERLVAHDDPESNVYAVKEQFFDEGMRRDLIHPEQIITLTHPDGSPRYLDELPNTIDILLFGSGEDGHIASLFPGSKQPEGNWMQIDDSPKPPAERISITSDMIFRSSLAVSFFIGSGKQEAYENWKNLPVAHALNAQEVVFVRQFY